jgi:lysophospholipase
MPDSSALEERHGFLPAKDNLRLFRRSLVPSAPRGAVLVVHGYADHSGRYLEVMGHLAARGFAHPNAAVAGAVLTDPYLKLAFAPPPVLVAISGLLSRVVPWFAVKNQLKAAMLTSDEAIQRATERDPLYNHTTTPRWFIESNRAQRNVLQRAPEYRWPSLILQGGADPVASPDATKGFFERSGSKDKELIVYEGFRHEIMNEVGRARVYEDIARWIEART